MTNKEAVEEYKRKLLKYLKIRMVSVLNEGDRANSIEQYKATSYAVYEIENIINKIESGDIE